MKRFFTICATVLIWAAPATAQDAGAGADLYARHCATCHGADAQGNGPMAPALVLQPPALNTLSARNDGVFPVVRVVMRTDGRDPLVSHGSPMPIYGPFFEGNDTPLKAETGQPIMTSRPIVDLVAFLRQIQQ